MATVNFHGVAMGAGVLAVECKACGRRASLTREDGLPIFRGCMELVRTVQGRLKCRSCGSKDVRAYAPDNREQALMFEAGDRMPPHTMVF